MLLEGKNVVEESAIVQERHCAVNAALEAAFSLVTTGGRTNVSAIDGGRPRFSHVKHRKCRAAG